jgi:hypothetical protein
MMIWHLIREVLTVGLGVAVILDAILDSHTSTAELVVGLLLVGFPLDRFLTVLERRRQS